MAKAKDETQNQETPGQDVPNTTAVNEKLDQQAQGPAVVQASDIERLGFADEDVDQAAAGSDQVQARVDEEQEAGMRGVKVDPTPNENYTVQGVTSGAPTPETDVTLREGLGDVRRLDGPRPL